MTSALSRRLGMAGALVTAALAACSPGADRVAAPTAVRPSADLAGSPTAAAISPNIVISQIYGAGGNANSSYKNDYIELYNRGSAPVVVDGWSVQYASATGTSWSNRTNLSGTIQPGHYYLIQEAGGTSGDQIVLPTPDLPNGTINLSGTTGKVALVKSTTALSGGCPTSDANVVDFVGFGTNADCFETGRAPAPSTTNAIFRAGNGATDTDNNTADFSAAAAAPRNSSTGAPVLVVTIAPANPSVNVGTGVNFTVSATFGGSSVPVTSATWSSGTPAVATIDASTGVASTVSTGTSSIGVSVTTSAGPGSASTLLTVNPAVGPLDHVALGGPTTVSTGASIQLTATPQDASNNTVTSATVTWSTSDANVATVDAAGKVTGVAASDDPVTITAVAVDGSITKFAQQQVTVTAPVIAWIDANVGTTGIPEGGFYSQLFLTARTGQGGTVIPATWTIEPLDPTAGTVLTVGTANFIVSGDVSVDTRPRFKLTATPVGGGQSYSFTSSPVTVENSAGIAASNYATNDEFGDPTPASAGNLNDLLISRNQYVLSYSTSRGTPNWVSYELDARQFGSEDRCNCFTPDPNLPDTYKIYTTDYTNGGFDRGHMTRSADRNGGNTDNAATYYLTNIVPQTAQLNQNVWAWLENDLADSAKVGGRAVYIVAGPLFNGPEKWVKESLGEHKIRIPDYTWKVALIVPRKADGTPYGKADLTSWDALSNATVIAVKMPNSTSLHTSSEADYNSRPEQTEYWKTFRTTVDALEADLGYNLLSLLQADLQTVVEAGDHAPVASFTAPGTGAEGQSLAFNAGASSDPDPGDALTYAWSWGDGSAAGTGVAPTHTFVDNGSYTVTLTVTDSHGWQRTTTRTVNVTNALPVPTMAPTATTVHVGQAFNPQAKFTDAGLKDATWKAVVAWGDGTSLSTSLLAIPTTAIRASKAYTTTGQYTVRFTVTDKDGGSAFVETTVTVVP